MADLYNLLGELDEQTDDVIKDRRLTVETAATEASEEWDSPDVVETPMALQEAEKTKLLQDNYEDTTLEETQNVENDLCSRLHKHWSQEHSCPELLEYDEAMVEDLKAQIEERQEWIDQMEGNGESVDALMATMAQLDLDRTRFVLSDWHTTRLAKIEAHPLYMREKADHMSGAEVEYLKHYGEIFEHHLRQTVLDHIPRAWQSLDEPHMIDKPDYDGYHFWLMKETIDSGDLEHEEGMCLVANYKEMREYMREGKVDLLL